MPYLFNIVIAYVHYESKIKIILQVFLTCIVLPFMAVTTSPGRVAVPLGIFSQSGIKAKNINVLLLTLNISKL